MSGKREILVKRKSLTGLTAWINANYKKQNGNLFTTNDVQKYIMRGHLPDYMGKVEIVRDSEITDAKLYNVIKDE